MQCDEIKSILLNRQTGIKLGSAVLLTGLISYLKFRPIAVLVSSIYLTWIYRTFYSNYHVQIPKELTLKCKNIYENLRELREKRPNVFCGFITSILFLLAVIGQVVNGTYILLACLIAGVFLTSKYEIKIIKENDATPSSCVDVDEFCPQMNETNFMILKQIGDHADDSSIFSVTNSSAMAGTTENDESDSDNELLPKNAIIPEPDEIDVADESDFLVDQNVVLTQSAEYKRKHFSNNSNTSSESDSDDSIMKGLDFKNIPVTATIEPHTSPSTSHNLLTNIQQTIARNLIENIITTSLDKPKSSQKVYDSDEDSDFEILDSEDIPSK